MQSIRRFGRLSGGLATAIVASTAFAHTDDPKADSVLPPYEGPGWYPSEGGIAGGGFSASGVTLEAFMSLSDMGLGATWTNDIWGYSKTSIGGQGLQQLEFAIIGLSNGTAFIDITQPGLPVVRDFISGPQSIWRDIKTYQNYAYIVSEGGSGIQVVDLSDIEGNGVSLVTSITTGGSNNSHNVAIDTFSGYLYRCGGSGNGLRCYDLANPASPEWKFTWSDRYSHDAQITTYTSGPYAGKQIAFSFGGYNNGWDQTGVDILDVTDKDNVIWLASYEYPNGQYCHQGWLSDDKQFLFVNDEKDEDNFGINSTMHVIDVSDLENPFEVTAWANGSAAITHNLYVKDNLVYAANYRSGMRIHDVTDPANPVEVGFFDTYPANDSSSFNSLWSTYPYFQSGVVIGSDREQGLFIWTTDISDGPTIPEDVDGDGDVDIDDVVQVILAFGFCPGCVEDLDGNDQVDIDDVIAVILAFGFGS